MTVLTDRLPIPIDVSDPTVTVNATYGFGSVAHANCADAGSGIASCNVPDPLDTSSVGLKTIHAHAVDRAGHTFDATLTYNVTQQVYYLHGSGGIANPPTLTLDSTAPGAAEAKYKDSSGISFSGGNPWKEVGTWAAAPAGSAQRLSGVGGLLAFLGLKNSDDQGTQFDLRAELFRNGVFAGSSTTACITGVTRNPDLARVVTAAFDPFAAVPIAAGDVLSLKLSTRIGTNPDGSKCDGPGGSHSNAVGLRVYFDAVSRSARFTNFDQ